MNPATHPSPPATGAALVRLLLAGVIVWLLSSLGLIVWFFRRVEDPGLAGVGVPFYAWSAGYPYGLLVLLLYGTIAGIARRVSWSVVGLAAAVYAGPFLLAGLLGWLLLGLQPLSVRQGDEPMIGTALAGPGLFLLHVAGLAAAFAARRRPAGVAALRAAAPPLAGVGIGAALALLLTVRSEHFRHRGDFELQAELLEWRRPLGLTVSGRLAVHRDASVFPHAFYQASREEGGRGAPVDSLRIGDVAYGGHEWANVPHDLAAGDTLPVRLVWNRLTTTSREREREVVLRLTRGPYYGAGPVVGEFRIPADPDEESLRALDAPLSSIRVAGKWGYADRTGRIVIPPRYDRAFEFSEGLAMVSVGGRDGFIDAEGEWAIPPTLTSATAFSEGLSAASAGRGYGFLDRTGAWAVEPRFESAAPFSEGLARVRIGGKDGFIDHEGKLAIEPRWSWAGDFHDGRAAVRIDEKWGFVDRRGEMAIHPRYDALRPFAGGRAEVMLGERWLRIDTLGNELQDEP